MFIKIIAAFKAALARAKAVRNGDWRKEYWSETEELGITFIARGERTFVGFDTISEIWAENFPDFFDKEVGLLLRTDIGVFTLVGGYLGYNEALYALAKHFGFSLDFYHTLRESEDWDLKITLFDRKTGE